MMYILLLYIRQIPILSIQIFKGIFEDAININFDLNDFALMLKGQTILKSKILKSHSITQLLKISFESNCGFFG